jgi:hypothetical protein
MPAYQFLHRRHHSGPVLLTQTLNILQLKTKSLAKPLAGEFMTAFSIEIFVHDNGAHILGLHRAQDFLSRYIDDRTYLLHGDISRFICLGALAAGCKHKDAERFDNGRARVGGQRVDVVDTDVEQVRNI